MLFYTIYRVTNLVNGKIYIGKHQTFDINDSYYGSGRAIQAAIKKYGKGSFTKEVLFVFETEAEMNAKEKELVNEQFVLSHMTYNEAIGGEGGPHFKGRMHSVASRSLIRENSKRVKTAEEIERLKENNKRTNASRGRKTSAALKGRPKTEEHRRRISESLKQKRRINNRAILRGSSVVVASVS